MPTNGLLECVIELGNSHLRLREYGTTYYDKTVETYVAIPSQPTPFGIRLNSHGYIAPGLSIYIFIDGIYQTNRNKRGLQPPKDDPHSADVEFRVGHKEDLLNEGRVIARGWWFEKLNSKHAFSNHGVSSLTELVIADAKPSVKPNVLDNLGTIEVVVLRCQDDPQNLPINPWNFPRLPRGENSNRQSSSSKKAHKQSKSRKSIVKEPSDDGDDDGGGLGGMFALFDGVADDDRPFGLDGNWDRGHPSYQYVMPRLRPGDRRPSFAGRPEQIPDVTDTRSSLSDGESPRRARPRQAFGGDGRREPRTSDYYQRVWETSGDENERRTRGRLPRQSREPDPRLTNDEDVRLERLRYQKRQEEHIIEKNRERARALQRELRHLERRKQAAQEDERARQEEQRQFFASRGDDCPPSPHVYEYSVKVTS